MLGESMFCLTGYITIVYSDTRNPRKSLLVTDRKHDIISKICPASKLSVLPWVWVEPIKTADVAGENMPGASGWECPGAWPKGYKIIPVSDKIQSWVSLCHQMDWKELV